MLSVRDYGFFFLCWEKFDMKLFKHKQTLWQQFFLGQSFKKALNTSVLKARYDNEASICKIKIIFNSSFCPNKCITSDSFIIFSVPSPTKQNYRTYLCCFIHKCLQSSGCKVLLIHKIVTFAYLRLLQLQLEKQLQIRLHHLLWPSFACALKCLCLHIDCESWEKKRRKGF